MLTICTSFSVNMTIQSSCCTGGPSLFTHLEDGYAVLDIGPVEGGLRAGHAGMYECVAESSELGSLVNVSVIVEIVVLGTALHVNRPLHIPANKYVNRSVSFAQCLLTRDHWPISDYPL